jgi:hypothetical protein
MKAHYMIPFIMCSLTVLAQATIMAVTGNSGNGNFDANSFYKIKTRTGESILIGSASITPNQLAYDQTSENYYYMDHTGSNFYRFDITTGTEYNMGDLTTVGMPSGKTGSGGGDFYNGKYFYTPETGTEAIYVISFNSSGSQIVSHTPISPSNLSDFSDLSNGSSTAGLGDFGDFAIDNSSGLMYGSSRMSKNGTAYNAFWTIDLTTPDFTMSMINDNLSNVYQLAFDKKNRLWANRWQSGGELYKLNTSDGTIKATRTLQVDDGSGTLVNANGDFYDLASTGERDGVTIIPEPSTLSLLTSAFLLLLRRKRPSHA